MKKINISFGKPQISSKEVKAVEKVLKSGKLVHGPMSLQFERDFKKFTGAKDAISVSSCTAGMHLFYLSLGIGKGDEVIIPSQTHVATAHAVELVGAKPVFVDSEYPTGNMNIDEVKRKINNRTKAITVVHYLGNPVNMMKLKLIIRKHKLLLLEDCALALGSKIKNKHVGLFGDAGFFSFYPVKHITTAEGGMIILKDKKYSKLLRKKKTFGYDKSLDQRIFPGIYDVDELGLNYRMSEIHATIGVSQLKKLKFFLKKRSNNFKYLKIKFRNIEEITIIPNLEGVIKGSYYCFSILLSKRIYKKRFKIIKYLKKKGIQTSIYYPHPIPRLSYYKKKYKLKLSKFKTATEFSDRIICFPVGPHINTNSLNYISNKLYEAIKTEL